VDYDFSDRAFAAAQIDGPAVAALPDLLPDVKLDDPQFENMNVRTMGM
jgi:hypothetical protein